jgi:hypothetical protein
MSSETFSVIAWFWHDRLTNATQLKVVRVDTSEEVHLSDGSFLLRISRDENTSVVRCLIRHLASGREAYIQSGEGIRAFIEASLLKIPKSLSESSIPSGVKESTSGPQASEPDSRPESSPPDVPRESADA